jgi:hypothetical protein
MLDCDNSSLMLRVLAIEPQSIIVFRHFDHLARTVELKGKGLEETVG